MESWDWWIEQSTNKTKTKHYEQYGNRMKINKGLEYGDMNPKLIINKNN